MRTNWSRYLPAAILLLTLVGANSLAQNPPAAPNEVALAMMPIEVKCRFFRDDQKVINDEDEWQELIRKADRPCLDNVKFKVDFQKYTLIVVNVFADCQALVSLRVTKNAEKKSCLVTVTEKYGGCRGMNLHNRSVLVEKLPPGYTVEFKSVRLPDRE